MQIILTCVIVVLLSTFSWAGRIHLTGVSATYYTAVNTIEFIVRFDRPYLPESDYLGIAAWPGLLTDSPPDEMFSLRSDGRVGHEILEPFHVGHVDYNHNGDIVSRNAMGVPNVVIDGATFTATMPYSMTGLDAPYFAFSVATHWNMDTNFNSTIDGMSSINQRITYTPEPSSVALAGIGVVLFGAHRLLRRRPRANRGASLGG